MEAVLAELLDTLDDGPFPDTDWLASEGADPEKIKKHVLHRFRPGDWGWWPAPSSVCLSYPPWPSLDPQKWLQARKLEVAQELFIELSVIFYHAFPSEIIRPITLAACL